MTAATPAESPRGSAAHIRAPAAGTAAQTTPAVMKRPAARLRAPHNRATMKRPARAPAGQILDMTDAQRTEEDGQDGDDEADARKPGAPAKKRPVKAQGRKIGKEFCKGSDGPCVFSQTVKGGAAKPHRPGQCMLCDNAQLVRSLEIRKGAPVVSTLKKLLSLDQDIFDKAAARVRALGGDAVVERVLTRRRNAAIQNSLPKKSTGEHWEELLAKRTAIRGELRETEAVAYEKKRLYDRAHIRRFFFTDDDPRKGPLTKEAEDAEQKLMPGECGDIAPNDTGLPAAQRSELAKRAELWCKFGSWTMCESCGSMNPRSFEPWDLRKDAKATIPKCSKCVRKISVPQPRLCRRRSGTCPKKQCMRSGRSTWTLGNTCEPTRDTGCTSR